MAKFHTVSLSEITTLVTKGTTPTTLGHSFTDSGVNFIKAESVTLDGQIDESVFAYIDEATHRKLKRSQIEEGDILFSIAGMKLGKSAVVKTRHVPANTNQAVAIIRADRNKALPEFLHYHFLNPAHYRYVNALTAQSAQPNINLGQIGSLAISIPPLPAQRRIAGILSAYDELIENCQRRIRILESMARALYREWFVHFRFPGHEKYPRVPSALGDIPQSWEVKALSALCSRIESGGTPKRKSSEYWANGSIDWFKTGELWDGFLFGSEEKITERGQRESNARIFDPGTILMAIYGSPTVGRLGIVTRPSSCNQAALGLVADKNQISQTFLYFVLISLREHFNGIAQGAAQQNISKEKVANAFAVVPPRELVAAFDRLADPTFGQIQTLQSLIQNLRCTRDLLLPRLLSGQIEIGNN